MEVQTRSDYNYHVNQILRDKANLKLLTSLRNKTELRKWARYFDTSSKEYIRINDYQILTKEFSFYADYITFHQCGNYPRFENIPVNAKMGTTTQTIESIMSLPHPNYTTIGIALSNIEDSYLPKCLKKIPGYIRRLPICTPIKVHGRTIIFPYGTIISDDKTTDLVDIFSCIHGVPTAESVDQILNIYNLSKELIADFNTEKFYPSVKPKLYYQAQNRPFFDWQIHHLNTSFEMQIPGQMPLNNFYKAPSIFMNQPNPETKNWVAIFESPFSCKKISGQILNRNYGHASWYGGYEGLRLTNWTSLKDTNITIMPQGTVSVSDWMWLIRKLIKDNHIEIANKVIPIYTDSNESKYCFPQHKVNSKNFRATENYLLQLYKTAEIAPTSLDGTTKNLPTVFSMNNLPKNRDQKFVIEPIITKNSFTLLYAATGIGKTWFSICLGMAIAKGGTFLKGWKIPQPNSVLYIDSELGENEFGRRLELISELNLSQKIPFHFINVTNWDLTEPSYQEKAEQTIARISNDPTSKGNIKFLILDNLSFLTGHQTSEHAWDKFFKWIENVKKSGISILLLHHSNKGGDQRGVNIKTFGADLILKLVELDSDNSSKHENRYDLVFEKTRHLAPELKRTIEISFSPSRKSVPWKISEKSKPKTIEEIKRMDDQGYLEKEIANALGISKSTVQRRRKELGLTKDKTSK